jgi:hypothetical protein
MVLGLVAVALAGELFARGLAPYLPEPDRYGDQARAVKVAQIDTRSGCTDIVVAGNSMARDGLDPAVITTADAAGRSVYNASLDAASPELLADWLGDVVQPRLGATVVVVAISTLDLNTGAPGTAAALASWRDAPAGAPGPLGALGRWAAGTSALVEHRTALRQPANVAKALGRWRRGEPAERTTADSLATVLGPDGEGLSRRQLVDAGDPVSRQFVQRQLLANYDLGADPEGRVASMVERVTRSGATVVLALLPTTGEFAGLHPRGATDLDEVARVVRSAAQRTGALVIDLRGVEPGTQGFADTHHLNGTGATAVSKAVPGALASAGVPVVTCTP